MYPYILQAGTLQPCLYVHNSSSFVLIDTICSTRRPDDTEPLKLVLIGHKICETHLGEIGVFGSQSIFLPSGVLLHHGAMFKL